MRTKHFLFSAALGAAFVACSSEQFEMPENNVTDAKLAIRPVVDVELTLAGKAQTRFDLSETGSRPVWSTNDKLGAAVIDVPNYATSSAGAANGPRIAKYNVVESYGCNNAFSTTDGGATWASDQPMVEGNYLFYAPYQVGLNYRTPLEVAVPRVQDASGEKTALEEFYNGNNIVQVGYKFITGAEKQRPTVAMYNIFAYPKFTIKNNFDGFLFDANNTTSPATAAFSGTMKIDSIQLVQITARGAANSDTPLAVGGQLKHTSAGTNEIATAGANNNSDGICASVIEALHQKDNGFAADGDWMNLDYMLGAKTTDLLSSSNQVTAGRHGQPGVITTLVVNKELAKGASMDIYAVMPACKFNYTDNMLAANIFVTINGVQYVIAEAGFQALGVNDAVTAANTKLNEASTKGYTFTAKNNAGLSSLSFMAGQSLPAEAIYVDGDHYAKKSVGGDLFTIELKGGKPTTERSASNYAEQIALRVSATAEVGKKTTADLINMIKTEAPNGTAWDEEESDTKKKFTIAPTNTVEINSDLIDALANYNQNAGGSFAISTVVPIASDVEVTAADPSTGVVSFKSVNGRTYDITLNGAVNTAIAGRYIINDGALAVSDEVAGSVVIAQRNTVSFGTADPKLKSLHVSSAASSAATIGVASTIDNICNYGTFTVNSALTSKVINNKKNMTVSATLGAPAGSSLALTNSGTIDTGNSSASFTVTAGTGEVRMEALKASAAVLVGPAANQTVIYVATDGLDATAAATASSYNTVNRIEVPAEKSITLTATADVAKFGHIKYIVMKGADISAHVADTLDMTGFTLDVQNDNATWTGSGVTQSIVKGLTVRVNGSYKLTLASVAFTEATMTGTPTAGGRYGIYAGGITATWNGGAHALRE